MRQSTFLRTYLILFFLLFTGSSMLFAQSGLCDPTTPYFEVDLSNDPNGTWISPPSTRVDNCCATSKPDRCIEFEITLAPEAVAINFQIVSGAVPPGALYYQINCGPLTSVGTPLCLNGPGPYTLTFCKPGNNINTYGITSISPPEKTPDDSIGDGCSTNMKINGLVESTISWTSIAPGPQGAYNSYLSCTTGCDSTIITPQAGYPPYIDYKVCGTPAGGVCVASSQFCDTIRIFLSPPIINLVTPNPAVFCANTSGITLTGTVNGGVPPYTYAWTNGSNGSGTIIGTGITYTATAAGNYSFIVYDKNYPVCPPKITNVPVTVSPVPVVNAGPDQTVCGTSTTLNGSVTGAMGGVWSGGNGTFISSNTTLNATYIPTSAELTNGTIVLTLTSTGNGACAAVSDQVVLRMTPPVVVALSAPSIICYGQTANITANVSGGIAPYSYLWSTGQTSQTITNIVPGSYTVTVTGTGASACTGTAAITIPGNPQIVVTTSPNNSISCNTTAIISATATGGTGALSYLWSTGATTPSTNVNSGTYIITITDAVGCTAYNSVSVTAANSSLLATINQPSILCNGATTTLNVVASGGFGSYSYAWSNGSNTNSTVVGAGNFCVTVTDGAGCITSACVNVTQSPLLNVSVPTPQIVCNGSSATATASVSGGQAPYNYLWSTGETTQSIIHPAGTYTLTVTDAIGCSKTTTVTITQAATLSATASTTAVSCFGGNTGSATVNVTGGVQSYYFSWAPYGGSFSAASGLMAGTYTVTTTDAIGCATVIPVTITQPNPLSASVSSSTMPNCYGGNNGSITVSATGGIPNYTYNWSPFGGSSPTATNLSAGTYTVYVTDANGCSQTAQATITQPALLTGTVSGTTSISCNGGNNGSGTVSGSGGTPGYTYLWSTGSSGSTAINLSAGTYTVTVTDAKGCTTPINVVITQPTILTAAISGSTNVSCNAGSNGTATVTPSGGTGPYSYLWNSSPAQTTATAVNLPVGMYTATVTDSKGCTVVSAGVSIIQPTPLTVSVSPSALISCNSSITISSSASGGTGNYSTLWNNGATTSSITVNTGTYIATITDDNGCTATNSVSVQAANSTLAATITQPANICNGSSITVNVNVTGGFGSNNYLWNTGATIASIPVTAGNYCVTVTDGGGCLANACVTVNQNAPLSVSIATPGNVCPGASTTVTANPLGGQAPYNYLWSNGQGTQSITQTAGTYSVTVTDAVGGSCTATASVTITQEPPLSASVSSTKVSCFGSNNGSASVVVSGGMPAYAYSWAPSGGSNATALNLVAGTYTVTVSDAIGCTLTANTIVTQPASAVAVTVAKTNVTCYNLQNGTAAATATGGTSPYNYYWSVNGSTAPTIAGLAQGTYSVVVADTTGCFISAPFTINQPADITLSETTVNAYCGKSNGSATVTATGGTGAYTYAWSPSGGNAATANNLLAGNYTVTVTDANLCQKTLALTVASTPSDLIANFSANAACLNTETSFTDLSTVISSPLNSWSWNFGEPSSGSSNFSNSQNPKHTYSSSGTFTVTLTVTTVSGCTNSVMLPVNVNPLPAASFTVTSSCVNSASTFTNTSSISAGSITNVSWNFGDPGSGANNISNLQNPQHTFVSAGSHLVILTVTSNNGCNSTTTQSVSIPFIPVADFNANSVCQTVATSFTDLSTVNNSTITAWSWDFGDGTIPGTNQSATHTYSTSGTFNVILKVTSASGCQDSDTMAVTVNPAAIPNFTGMDVCLNDTTSFTNLSTITTGTISSWKWDFGNFSPNNIAKDPKCLYAAPGTFSVTLTATSSNGCTSSIVKTVNVYPRPNALFTANNSCVDNTTQFTDLSTAPAGTTINSWKWAFGDGSPVVSSKNTSHIYAVAGTYNPLLVVTTNNGCTDTVTQPITIYPKPLVNFSVDDSSGCENYCTQFTDISIPLNGTITSWAWNFGDGSPIGASKNPMHCYPISGLYTISLEVKSSYGCVATETKVNLISVLPVPEAEFTFSPQPPTILNSTVYFSDQSVNATSWLWDFGDPSNTSTSDVQHPNHFYPPDTGIYCIQLNVANDYGCVDTVIHCLEIKPEFTFYIPNAFTPNASNGINDTFRGKGTYINEFEMWIFDRWGNMIFYTDNINIGWDGRANGGKYVAQQDVYVYKVELYDFTGNKHKYIGPVTIVK